MPSDVEQIDAIKSQTLQVLKDITLQPKPSYEIDGQRFSWNEYLERLQQIVDWCDRKLTGYQPFEIESQGHS